MKDFKMKKAPNKPDIFFITSTPQHPTNKDIIKELSSTDNVVGFEIIDPASQAEIFANIANFPCTYNIPVSALIFRLARSKFIIFPRFSGRMTLKTPIYTMQTCLKMLFLCAGY